MGRPGSKFASALGARWSLQFVLLVLATILLAVLIGAAVYQLGVSR